MAAKEGHEELLRELLAAGASPNPPDVSHTPLRGAAIFGRDGCIRLLLDAAADPNHCSAGRRTPLMGASMSGHESTVALLLAAGADPSVTNDFGESAGDLASAKGHGGCAKQLESAAARDVARKASHHAFAVSEATAAGSQD